MVSQSTHAEMNRLIRGGLAGAPVETTADERSKADIQRGLKRLKHQREICDRADSMYNGEEGLTFASHKVRRLLTKHGIEEIDDFNYARIPVDAIANRLQIAAINVAPAEENADGQEAKENAATKAAEKMIAQLRKRNQLDAEEKRLHKDVSKHGEAYLLVWPVADDGGAVVDVDMRVNSAHNVAMIYDEEDSLQPDFVIKSWITKVDKKDTVRANLYYAGTEGRADGRVERWATEPGSNPDEEKSWFRVRDVPDVEPDELAELAEDEFTEEDDDGKPVLDVDDIPNPWGQVWYHFRNDRPEGRPEHASAYGPQTLINKLIFGHAATIDYQSFPQRYLLQDPAIDDPMINSEDPDHPDDDEDDPETETGTSGLKSDPAVVWKLWGRLVGEFSAADPRVFLDPLDRYIRSMAELTGLALYEFTKSSSDMPSGSALRELNGTRNALVKDRQDRYDPQWQDAYEKALQMLGIEGVTVDVRWEPPELINDLDGWQMLQAKQAAGVPASVTYEEAGYAPELIEQWLADRDGSSFEQRIALLEKIGTAVQALGAGVTLGVVSETTVQALVERLLRGLIEGVSEPEDSDDPLPGASFRDPPPSNPAMAQAEAAGANPLTQAQIEATRASAESSRASAAMLSAGGGLPAAGRPVKRAADRPGNRPTDSRRPS
jgi:hypothetical protein